MRRMPVGYQPNTLLPTSLVGSHAQLEWLIDRNKLAGRFPPRVQALELWRAAPEHLDEAHDDATILSIRDQERTKLDIITDGEMRRESYSNRFAMIQAAKPLAAFEDGLVKIHIDLKGLNEEAAELAAQIARNFEELGA
jgi:hypothetical protein